MLPWLCKIHTQSICLLMWRCAKASKNYLNSFSVAVVWSQGLWCLVRLGSSFTTCDFNHPWMKLLLSHFSILPLTPSQTNSTAKPETFWTQKQDWRSKLFCKHLWGCCCQGNTVPIASKLPYPSLSLLKSHLLWTFWVSQEVDGTQRVP